MTRVSVESYHDVVSLEVTDIKEFGKDYESEAFMSCRLRLTGKEGYVERLIFAPVERKDYFNRLAAAINGIEP